MLTHETSEGIATDLWPPNRTSVLTSAVTVLLLFHIFTEIQSDINFSKCTNTAVNMTRKFLQDISVTEPCKVG